MSWKAPKCHALVEVNQLGCSAAGLGTLVLAEFTGVLSNQFVSLSVVVACN